MAKCQLPRKPVQRWITSNLVHLPVSLSLLGSTDSASKIDNTIAVTQGKHARISKQTVSSLLLEVSWESTLQPVGHGVHLCEAIEGVLRMCSEKSVSPSCAPWSAETRALLVRVEDKEEEQEEEKEQEKYIMEEKQEETIQGSRRATICDVVHYKSWKLLDAQVVCAELRAGA